MKSPVELAVHRPYATVLDRAPVVAGRAHIARPCLREVRPRSGRLSPSDADRPVFRDRTELISDALCDLLVAVAAREAFFRPLVDLLSRLSRKAGDQLDLFLLQALKDVAHGIGGEESARGVRNLLPHLEPCLVVGLGAVGDHLRGDLTCPVAQPPAVGVELRADLRGRDDRILLIARADDLFDLLDDLQELPLVPPLDLQGAGRLPECRFGLFL